MEKTEWAAKWSADEIFASTPPVIMLDEDLAAICYAAARQFEKTRAGIEQAGLYTHIDSLDERVLDDMAEGMSLSWWDYGYSVETKRKLMKRAGAIQKLEGTDWAVLEVLRAVFDEGAEVHYWYDDQTIPVKRFVVTFKNANAVNLEDVHKAIERVKRAGMILDGLGTKVEVRIVQENERLSAELTDISGVAVWNGEFMFDGEIYFDSEAQKYE